MYKVKTLLRFKKWEKNHSNAYIEVKEEAIKAIAHKKGNLLSICYRSTLLLK